MPLLSHGQVAVALLCAVLAFAGCAAKSVAPDGANGTDSTGTGSQAKANGTAASPARPAEPPLRTYPVTFHWEAYHQVPIQRPYCDPSQPGVCEAYYQGEVYDTGDINGTGQFYGHGHGDASRPGAAVGEIYFFTGKVKGCGEGTFEYSWKGWAGPDAAYGGLHIHAEYAYVNGTASTGLAGLVAFHGTTDTSTLGVGDVHGEITCR